MGKVSTGDPQNVNLTGMWLWSPGGSGGLGYPTCHYSIGEDWAFRWAFVCLRSFKGSLCGQPGSSGPDARNLGSKWGPAQKVSPEPDRGRPESRSVLLKQGLCHYVNYSLVQINAIIM